MNAVNGNVIRDAEGNAVSISQNYQVATDEATFDEFSRQIMETIQFTIKKH